MLDLSEGNTLNFYEIVYAGQLDGQGGVIQIPVREALAGSVKAR